MGGKFEIRNSKSEICREAGYTVAVTWGFAYLLMFLGGFTLSLVTGFARRLLHPSELCDNVVVPSHEHLQGLRYPAADLLASFLTLFGFASLIAHGVTALAPRHEMAIGAGAGLAGIFILKSWLYKVCDPSEQLSEDPHDVRVVREIPANGYGQVEVSVQGTQLKMAARTDQSRPIPVGAIVKILDRTESVVVVKSQPLSG